MKKKHTGFTLIELMVMLAVLAVVMSVGVPQLTMFFKGGRMVTNTNDLVAALRIARSTAIKEGKRVTLCKSTNAESAARTCDATAAVDWDQGWFVFVEGTNAGNVTGFYSAATDGAVVRVNTGAEGDDTTIKTANAAIANFVSFSSRGLPTNANGFSVNGTFMVCDDRGLKNASGNVVANGIVLMASGRAGSSKVETKIGVCP